MSPAMPAASPRAMPARGDGTYEILIASIQALSAKLNDFGATVMAMDKKLDDFQEMVQTRYMPRTEFDAALRESRDDRTSLRSAMVYRDAYLATQAETTRRLERLESGPQRLIGWFGVGIGCLSLVLGGVTAAITFLGIAASLFLVLR